MLERVDRLTINSLKDQPLHNLGIQGRVVSVEEKVKMLPRQYGEVLLLVGGRLDLLVELDTGGMAIYDVKMTVPSQHTTERYRRQNAAYALALRDGPRKIAIQQTGLLCITPTFMQSPKESYVLMDNDTGEMAYNGIARKPVAFMGFDCTVLYQAKSAQDVEADIENELMPTLTEMGAVLSADRPPPAGNACQYCGYVASIMKFAQEMKEVGK